jgi:hypothetical protein
MHLKHLKPKFYNYKILLRNHGIIREYIIHILLDLISEIYYNYIC